MAVSAASGAGNDAASDGGFSFAQARAALVQVGHARSSAEGLVPLWLGTGFLVDDDCTVVTAKHILQGVPRDGLVLQLEDPARRGTSMMLSARVLHEAPDRDLAFLRIAETAPGTRCSSKALGRFELARALDPQGLAGLDVRVAGFPVLEGEPPRGVPILRRGSIASAELSWEGKPMLLLDLTGVPGFSGAPVILESTGEAIGVVFGPGRTERQYDLEWATPLTRDDYREAMAAARREP